MAYAAPQDLIDLFGTAELVRLTAADGVTSDVPDPAMLGRALGDASDLVDTHLRRRYAVPLVTPAAPVVVRITADIAHLLLAQSGDATVSDKVRGAYDAALRWLEGVAAGRLSIDGLQTNTGPMTTDRRRTLTAGPFACGGFGGFEWAW